MESAIFHHAVEKKDDDTFFNVYFKLIFGKEAKAKKKSKLNVKNANDLN